MLAIFDTNQDISLAEINIKFTKCSNNTVAIVYSKQVVILFFECTLSKYLFIAVVIVVVLFLAQLTHQNSMVRLPSARPSNMRTRVARKKSWTGPP